MLFIMCKAMIHTELMPLHSYNLPQSRLLSYTCKPLLLIRHWS